MDSKCRQAFLDEWIVSPFNKWRYFIFKWVSYKCFRAGWFNYMGSPIPHDVAETIGHYDPDHPTSAWFSIGYIRAKIFIEGIPTCECCGEPVCFVIEKSNDEENGGRAFEKKID